MEKSDRLRMKMGIIHCQNKLNNGRGKTWDDRQKQDLHTLYVHPNPKCDPGMSVCTLEKC